MIKEERGGAKRYDKRSVTPYVYYCGIEKSLSGRYVFYHLSTIYEIVGVTSRKKKLKDCLINGRFCVLMCFSKQKLLEIILTNTYVCNEFINERSLILRGNIQHFKRLPNL